MANTTNLNVRIDEDIKSKADAIFAELGLNTSAAVNIFLRYCVRYDGIPFELRLDKPNAETVEAMREVERMRKNPDAYKSYTDVDDMMKELLSDDEI